MIASIRFWRAIRNELPDSDAGASLWAKLEREPPEGRKRHLPWKVDLSAAERAVVDALMWRPPTPYLAFLVGHHLRDTLAREQRE